jgi:hypothetical protein
MQRIPSRLDLDSREMASLRDVVARSFVGALTIPASQKARLLELGLISNAMGGLIPTPAGRIVARM